MNKHKNWLVWISEIEGVNENVMVWKTLHSEKKKKYVWIKYVLRVNKNLVAVVWTNFIWCETKFDTCEWNFFRYEQKFVDVKQIYTVWIFFFNHMVWKTPLGVKTSFWVWKKSDFWKFCFHTMWCELNPCFFLMARARSTPRLVPASRGVPGLSARLPACPACQPRPAASMF